MTEDPLLFGGQRVSLPINLPRPMVASRAPIVTRSSRVREADRDAWSTVQHRLGDRDRELRKT
jgi:hypothetical protein